MLLPISFISSYKPIRFFSLINSCSPEKILNNTESVDWRKNSDENYKTMLLQYQAKRALKDHIILKKRKNRKAMLQQQLKSELQQQEQYQQYLHHRYKLKNNCSQL